MKIPAKARLRAVHNELTVLSKQIHSKQIATRAIADRLDDVRVDVSTILDEMEDA